MIRRINIYLNNSMILFDSLRLQQAHNAYVSNVVFKVRDISGLDIGSQVTLDIEIDGYRRKLFTGYVKETNYSVPDRMYELMAMDILVRAKDYFIASSTPDSAYKAKNIAAEDLVRDILNMAGITSFAYDPTNFTFAIHTEVEVNLVNALDYVKRIADILAYTVWADENGVVQFRNRQPYVTNTDSPSLFINTSNIISYRYSRSDRDLRNRVVIYGDNVYAEAKASSPYLPPGFYKTVVLASPLIQSQSFADKAAQYNLQLLNRLTEELYLEVEGNPDYTPWKVANISGLGSPIDGDWYVYNVSHNIDTNGGYLCSMVLRR